jgi:thymidylate synthase (FAD)
VLGLLESEKEMVDITATYIDHMGSDLSVVNAARVSFGKKSTWDFECDCVTDLSCIMAGGCDCGEPQNARQLSKRDTKLIKYLAKHRHISPFGHAFASFHVRAPIFVARQLVKHKFLRWNEVSKRYVDDTPELYEPYWRSRSADKKQGSGGAMEISLDAEMMFHATCRNALTTYNMMIEEGVAPEQARSILPQNMMTEWYWSGSLDAFASMCGLRCKPDTQYESRIVAEAIDDKMMKLFPVSWEALRAYEE